VNLTEDAYFMLFSVNDQSIMSRKRRALRRSRTLAHDTETQQSIPPSRISTIVSKVKAPFSRVFWEDALEKSDDETLVDFRLLSYAYLEAGVIEMLGASVFLCVVVRTRSFQVLLQSCGILCCILQRWFHSVRLEESTDSWRSVYNRGFSTLYSTIVL
jgi:hypothetical protein